MTNSLEETMHRPFPGADAHPDKRGGELCVEGTRVPVARILAELTEGKVALDGNFDSRPKAVEDVASDFDLDVSTVRRCLRGLANWLKTQQWTGNGDYAAGVQAAYAWLTSHKCDKLSPDYASSSDRISDAAHAMFGALLSKKQRCESPDEKPPLLRPPPHPSLRNEKRCKTCAFGGGDCSRIRIEAPDGETLSGVGPLLAVWMTVDDGPPWENCRFWQMKNPVCPHPACQRTCSPDDVDSSGYLRCPYCGNGSPCPPRT